MKKEDNKPSTEDKIGYILFIIIYSCIFSLSFIIPWQCTKNKTNQNKNITIKTPAIQIIDDSTLLNSAAKNIYQHPQDWIKNKPDTHEVIYINTKINLIITTSPNINSYILCFNDSNILYIKDNNMKLKFALTYWTNYNNILNQSENNLIDHKKIKTRQTQINDLINNLK